jgi:anion-transporting  ArsA/GET3 family ATPase
MTDGLWQRRVIFVLGKGGVGRSTVAHALALAAASHGRSVGLVEVNGARSLAQAFGVRPRHEAVAVADRVALMSMSAAGCLEEYVADRLKVAPLARAVFRTRLMGALLDGIPGMSDLLHHGKIHSLVDPARPHRYDLLVVDAPATGHGLQFLETPNALAEMTRRGPLHEEAALIAARLADPAHTASVVVTLGEELPVLEAVELVDHLGPRRATARAIVANQLVTDPLPVGVSWEQLRPGLPPEWIAVGERRARRLAGQARALERLTETGLPRVELPALPPPLGRRGHQRLAELLARELR